MKLTKAQLALLAQGQDMATVLAMSTAEAPEEATLTEIQATVTTLAAEKETLTAERDALVTQLATVTGEKEALSTEIETNKTTLATAQTDAETLKTIVATAVTSLSIAVGSKVDTAALTPADLVTKHAELSAAVKDKFKNVAIADINRTTAKPVPSISPTRLANAKSIKII